MPLFDTIAAKIGLARVHPLQLATAVLICFRRGSDFRINMVVKIVRRKPFLVTIYVSFTADFHRERSFDRYTEEKQNVVNKPKESKCFIKP